MTQSIPNQTVQNLTGRLVTFRGNSGQTWHLPPKSSVQVHGSEVANNQKCRKLEENKIIALPPPRQTKKTVKTKTEKTGSKQSKNKKTSK